MQTIDFLPEHYRERRRQRRVRYWWALVVCLFGGIVLGTGSLQWLNVLKIKHELNRLEAQVATIRQLDQQLHEIETQIAAASHHANLYTFLKHPWPRTQILGAVVHPLPAEIELTTVRIAETLVAKGSKSAAVGGDTVTESPPDHPAIADLKQLHDAQEAQRVVVMIEGTAREVEHLHNYLDALGQHALVAEARLNSMETRKYETYSLVVFQVQLTIKSGHGLSDGPTGPLSPTSSSPETAAVSGSSRDYPEETLR
jgi:Tfp pilus assembly protein PilN